MLQEYRIRRLMDDVRRMESDPELSLEIRWSLVRASASLERALNLARARHRPNPTEHP